MDSKTQAIIQEAANGSGDGRLHFNQVIALLTQAGVESYRADYRSRKTTYYLPNGETFDVDLAVPDEAIAQAFDAGAIKAAIRGSQQGIVKYAEFKRRSCQAGCIGYTVWLEGRHVTYFGRKGEIHIERFPS